VVLAQDLIPVLTVTAIAFLIVLMSSLKSMSVILTPIVKTIMAVFSYV